MDSLKIAIFNQVREHHDKSKTLSDEELSQLIFHHSSGLRLSFTGFVILKNIFTVYSFEIDCELKSRHFIGMSKMEFPYYMTKRRLILFSEMDSMVIKLHGGIKGFLETCFNIDRNEE